MESTKDTAVEVYELELCRFLKARIQKIGGQILLQHITGHLSQLRIEVRNALGTSKLDITRILQKYSETFIIDKEIVSLVTTNNKDIDGDDSSSDVETHLPPRISEGKGVIVKLTQTFGFIKTSHPIKSSVFFRAKDFGFDDNTDLTDCGLNIGTVVNFHAKKEEGAHSSKYRATKVWKTNKDDTKPIVGNVKKKNGSYDPKNFDGEGTIQNVFPSHGFIVIDNDNRNTVFFFKKCVLYYDNITDLTKVFVKGDLVEFCSHRTTKANCKARWEATRVWKKSKKNSSVLNNHTFPSSGTNSVKSKSNFIVRTVNSDFHDSCVTDASSIIRNKTQEIIHDQVGKICPRASGCVIKFGKNFELLADGGSCMYYIDGTRVEDVSWQFSEGDKVKFDAVKIKSTPGWKAMLVWMGGEKPNIESPDFVDVAINTDDIEVTDSSDTGYEVFSSQHSSQKSETIWLERENMQIVNENKFEFSCGKITDGSEFESQSLSRSSSFSERPQSSLSSSKESETYFNSNILQNFTVDDSDDSKSNFSDNSEDSKNLELPIAKVENDFSSVEKTSHLELKEVKESEKLVGIKKYQNVEAIVSKVYSMSAEAEVCDTTYTFLGSVFYFDGNSLDDLDLNDLREVLKVGQTIFFNSFEIIDDCFQNWKKVTLAWLGGKPQKAYEMTPDEFIDEHELSVSVRDISYVSPENFKMSQSNLYKIVPQLKAELNDDKQNFETCQIEKDSKEVVQKLFAKSEIFEESLMYESLSVLICQNIQTKKDIYLNTKDDLDVFASDILDLILKKYGKSSKSSEELERSSCVCMKDGTISHRQKVITENVEAQTLITGPVFAPNVFADV